MCGGYLCIFQNADASSSFFWKVVALQDGLLLLSLFTYLLVGEDLVRQAVLDPDSRKLCSAKGGPERGGAGPLSLSLNRMRDIPVRAMPILLSESRTESGWVDIKIDMSVDRVASPFRCETSLEAARVDFGLPLETKHLQRRGPADRHPRR